jgi:hypothetical protein
VENVKRGSSLESGDEPPGSMRGTKRHLLIDCQLNKHDRVQFHERHETSPADRLSV